MCSSDLVGAVVSVKLESESSLGYTHALALLFRSDVGGDYRHYTRTGAPFRDIIMSFPLLCHMEPFGWLAGASSIDLPETFQSIQGDFSRFQPPYGRARRNLPDFAVQQAKEATDERR